MFAMVWMCIPALLFWLYLSVDVTNCEHSGWSFSSFELATK